MKELLLAANYLDIPKLLDYCSMTVADQIRGKKKPFEEAPSGGGDVLPSSLAQMANQFNKMN